MKNRFFLFIIFISVLFFGCDAAINMQGKVASLSSGKFFYQDGNLISEYKADMDPVWTACEKTVADLRAKDVRKERTISRGIIKAVIEQEKVVIKVEYVDRGLTSVSVFTGTVGNNMASRLIHDKIVSNLAKN